MPKLNEMPVAVLIGALAPWLTMKELERLESVGTVLREISRHAAIWRNSLQNGISAELLVNAKHTFLTHPELRTAESLRVDELGRAYFTAQKLAEIDVAIATLNDVDPIRSYLQMDFLRELIVTARLTLAEAMALHFTEHSLRVLRSIHVQTCIRSNLLSIEQALMMTPYEHLLRLTPAHPFIAYLEAKILTAAQFLTLTDDNRLILNLSLIQALLLSKRITCEHALLLTSEDSINLDNAEYSHFIISHVTFLAPEQQLTKDTLLYLANPLIHHYIQIGILTFAATLALNPDEYSHLIHSHVLADIGMGLDAPETQIASEQGTLLAPVSPPCDGQTGAMTFTPVAATDINLSLPGQSPTL